jgi:hypothetical protein
MTPMCRSRAVPPVLLAWALVPLGWDALDLLLAVACRNGAAPDQQEWTPELNEVGWWLCQFLSTQESVHGC